MTRSRFPITLAAFMLIMCAALFLVPAYAADDPLPENLTVDAVWLEGDMLQIEVTDRRSGVHQTLQLPLKEYAMGSEFVSVQAVDRDGNTSNTIQFKNPFYTPETDPAVLNSESGIPSGAKPFTPDGTGTVIDNVTEVDGKEFFSIESADGNVFYLIVDRQRSTENVYLLNAVTEDDLMSLAKEGKGTTESAIPTPRPSPAGETVSDDTPPPLPEPEPQTSANGGMSSGTVIFISVASIAAGVAGYYFKILRPKSRAAASDDDDGYDEYDGDDDYDYDDEDYGDPGKGGDEE